MPIAPLHIIDGIGPFFRDEDGHRVNWSKIAFPRLERNGHLDPDQMATIHEEFARFTRTAAQVGFNAVTLDDIAHLTQCAVYPADLRTRIAEYRDAYRGLFAIAARRGLNIFVTSDILFFNPALEAHLGKSQPRMIAFFKEALASLFEDFPEVRGVILRIGESDGLDVAGDFRSRLTVRTPAQARRWLQELLPVCETHDRLLIFRTWSVGAYPIGDLIWNRNTYRDVFGAIHSDHLVISMKYGETDFFRYLPVNKQFFRSDHQKIVEFQARREYEGFGEYPSFVGDDYAAAWKRIRTGENIVGAQVWCQTGGWSVFRRLTFLDPNAVWNDLNTFVTLRIVRDGATADDAVRDFWDWYRWPGAPGTDELLALMRLSDDVIKELLYIDDFACQKLFFRRLRVPPLLSVFWDQIIINHAMRKNLRCFVHHGERSVRQGREALAKIERMQDIAERLDLPAQDLQFQYDTFEILATAREYYFRPYSPDITARCRALALAYRKRYTRRYSVHLDFQRVRIRRSHLRILFRFFLRRQRGYRLVDRVITIRALAILHPVIRLLSHRFVPGFARKRAMGFDTILR